VFAASPFLLLYFFSFLFLFYERHQELGKLAFQFPSLIGDFMRVHVQETKVNDLREPVQCFFGCTLRFSQVTFFPEAPIRANPPYLFCLP